MDKKKRIKEIAASPLFKKRMMFLVVAIVCGLAAFLFLTSKPEDRTAMKEAAAQVTGMPVSVQTIQPGAYPAVVKVLGEVVPHWQTTIKSQVEGQIVFISDRLEAGNIVRQGEPLVRIAKSHLEMQVSDAKSRLAAATVVLLREEREAREAQKNWKQSGIRGEPESPLVLREPQLEAARSDVNAARSALAHAETLLGHTEIRAPFDGVIMKRNVNPGEILFAGDEVTTLYGMETAEVGVHLDAAQWALLPDSVYDAGIKLVDPRLQASWDARAIREGRHLNPDSRLRTLFLQVKQPLRQSPPLLPGTFVRAEITGRNISDLLRIPEAALTKDGRVWFVDSGNRLRSRRLDPVFHGEGVVYIHAPETTDKPLRVAVSPNLGFTDGLIIQPIENPEKET